MNTNTLRDKPRTTATIVAPEDYEAPLKVVGTAVTVLAAQGATQGQIFTYQAGARGMGPPPHSHGWDEAFFVTKGSVDFVCDQTHRHCTPGTLVVIPKGTAHSFQFGENGGEMLEITGAGSKADSFFAALDAEIPPGVPDITKVIEVATANGVSLHMEPSTR